MSGERYVAKNRKPLPLTAEQEDFLHRRTFPFLDTFGLQTRPLSAVVVEVYLQGIADTLDALSTHETKKPGTSE